MTLVIDASVIVKWFLPEAGSTEARALSDEDLVAPELWISETANALWKRQARGDIEADAIEVFLASIARPPIRTTPPADDVAAALALAIRLGHPVYDCLYLACALRHETAVITADRRFFAAASRDAGLAPHIRLLGA